MSEIIASTYEVIKEIGSGGGGKVYLAKHLRLGKLVVLKEYKHKTTKHPEILRREVDVLKDLKHPYIPNVYDFFSTEKTVYAVMDYIEGESLNKPLKRGERFSQAQVIQWAKQLLEALEYLHSPTHGTPPKGFIHSDIKPANIMRTPDNNICLIDFNIALALGENTVIGFSAGYASPEHYGIDYSSRGEQEGTLGANAEEDINTDDTLCGEDQTLASRQDITWADRKETEDQTLADRTGTMDETMASIQVDGKEEKIIRNLSKEASAIQEEDRKGRTGSQSSSLKRILVVPDVRSDIYSTGATLYHLLSGKRPARSAKAVVPLSDKEFSPQVVKIISKAMNPDPDLRYQTAREMWEDFDRLRRNDPRIKRQKKSRIIASILFGSCFAAGIGVSFVGLKRMQTAEQWLKLAEYSQNALRDGDTDKAIEEIMKTFPTKRTLLEPDYLPKAQKALTDALGVYDLSDGYKIHKVLELSSAPFTITIAPDGKTACCIYAASEVRDGNIPMLPCAVVVPRYVLAVVDTETGDIMKEFTAEESALSQVKYLDEDTILYAGKEGLTAYRISTDQELWKGQPATSICISGDGKTAATVYKQESRAIVYDIETGEIKKEVDFGGKRQSVAVNDIFADPEDNLLALDENADWLGVSFEDGSLKLYPLTDSERDEPEKLADVIIYDETSGYSHFEGGFYQNYFAFSASGIAGSVFAVIDTEKMEQTGGFESENPFGVQTDETGIYVQTDNVLVRIHPVTGEQVPLVTMSDPILHFARSKTHTVVTSAKEVQFFDQNANLTAKYEKELESDLVQIADGIAMIGSKDSPSIRIMKYESHPETEIFSYDPSYLHDEARVSADGETVMLFSYRQFRLYHIDGEMIAEIDIPDAEQVYDQQYIREEKDSWLEVIYNDGTRRGYSAKDGQILYERSGEKPDLTLHEAFLTDTLRIESPLHGAPEVYDIKTGKYLCSLSEDAYLTYITQVGDKIISQYVTTEGKYYGELLNENCEVLARLPYLSDIMGDILIFDYPTGNMRQSRIYNIQELIYMAQTYK